MSGWAWFTEDWTPAHEMRGRYGTAVLGFDDDRRTVTNSSSYTTLINTDKFVLVEASIGRPRLHWLVLWRTD